MGRGARRQPHSRPRPLCVGGGAGGPAPPPPPPHDLVRYLDRDLLISLWPTLRTLISRDVREVWEHSFDELAHSARAAA
ncbi:hypothetical protein ACFXAR_02850 [Streptomyces rubiginosohelvolus]|uniref:hypothetical protein n=1 Tax=Streptomyces rubiginosohelvolus TaxID=67362 RepID=UPI0036A63267